MLYQSQTTAMPVVELDVDALNRVVVFEWHDLFRVGHLAVDEDAREVAGHILVDGIGPGVQLGEGDDARSNAALSHRRP